MYQLALLRRKRLYMVVFARICWPVCVVGARRNWLFSEDISFLVDFSDWSYHLRSDFCFLVGGPLFRNLTVCLVSSRIML